MMSCLRIEGHYEVYIEQHWGENILGKRKVSELSGADLARFYESEEYYSFQPANRSSVKGLSSSANFDYCEG